MGLGTRDLGDTFRLYSYHHDNDVSINESDRTNFIVSPKNPRDVPLWYYFSNEFSYRPGMAQIKSSSKKSCQRYYLFISNQFYFETINWTRTLNPPGNRLLVRAAVAGGCVFPGKQRCSHLKFFWKMFDRNLLLYSFHRTCKSDTFGPKMAKSTRARFEWSRTWLYLSTLTRRLIRKEEGK